MTKVIIIAFIILILLWIWLPVMKIVFWGSVVAAAVYFWRTLVKGKKGKW